MKILNSSHYLSHLSYNISVLDKSTSLILSLLACALSAGVMLSASAATIYVNGSAPAGGNGSSWSTAFNNIGAGLDAATTAATPGTVVDVWVAGSANPYPMARCNYPLPNNVNLYGGFAGTETQISQRGFTGNLPTVQSTLVEPNSGTNCYLFNLSGTTNRFDGISIVATGGILQSGGALTAVSDTFRNDPIYDQATAVAGAGIVSYNGGILIVDKSLFQNLLASTGGAIASVNATSVAVTNSTFIGNQALGAQFWNGTGSASLSGGGAIIVDGNFSYAYYNFGAPVSNTKVTISGNMFLNNTAGGPSGGGAIHVEDSDAVSIANSTFGALDINNNPVPSSGNNASNTYGGAISLGSSNLIALNKNNFYGNAAYSGGAVYSQAENVNGSLSVTTNNFNGNNAVIGGAISDGGEMSNGSKTFTLNINSNNSFTHNTANKGPAIYYDGTEATVDGKTTVPAIDNAIIKSNTNLRSSDISP